MKRPATRKKMALIDRAVMAADRIVVLPFDHWHTREQMEQGQRIMYRLGYLAGYRAAQRDAKKGAK